MELPSSAVTLALGARPVSAVDPHLLVLGLLVAAWVIDRMLAAVEWLQEAGGDGADDPSGPRVGAGGSRGDPGGSAKDGGRPSGAE